MAEFDLLIKRDTFDATLEQILEVVEKYLEKLTEAIPNAGIIVTHEVKDGKKICNIKIIEVQRWGEPDIIYINIEAIQVYVRSDKPMRVEIYCPKPDFVSYCSGLSRTFGNFLQLSDGTPGLTTEPWMEIPAEDDREILRLWIEKNTAEEIGRRLDLSPQTIYNKLAILRKEYPEIVPYKRPGWKKKGNQ